MAPASNSIAIISGVGPGTGSSIARVFAKKYPVVLLARNPANYEFLVSEIQQNGGKALGISADNSSADSLRAAFDKIKASNLGGREDGQVKVAAAVLNGSGGYVRKPFLDLTLDEYDAGVAAAGRGAFLFSQAVLPLLQSHNASASTPDAHPGTLIFTGATASVKGSANYATFAGGKWAIRALAQSLAREFGPRGVHVAHAVIDGVIDIPRTKEWDLGAEDAKISPEAIADAYWHLHTQPRTSFTFEIDIRPYIEKW